MELPAGDPTADRGDVIMQVREKLQNLDGYFLRLADAMEAWVDAWEQHNSPHSSTAAEAKALPAKDVLPNGKALPNGTASPNGAALPNGSAHH